MRVAVVGLGDIAAKAYLPVLAADPRLTPVLVTRDPDVRDRLGRAHRTHTHADVGAAVAAGLDAAFVTAATEAHVPLVSQLLEARVPVHVDKPLSGTYEGAAQLVDLAVRLGVSLAVGFNRRHAPAYAETAGWPERDVVIMHKHRTGPAGDPRQVVFDDFVHVLDTLRFLVTPEPDAVDVSARTSAGLLHRVLVTLRQGDRVGIGVMDRSSGTTREVLEVLAPGRRRRVVDLVDVVDHEGGAEMSRPADGWAPIAEQRGFAGLCHAFLEAVRAGRLLDASDALQTHSLCERVVRSVGVHDA